MAQLLEDTARAELVARITSNYLLAFNGPDMRPPDQITVARFIETITEAFDGKFPRPGDSE